MDDYTEPDYFDSGKEFPDEAGDIDDTPFNMRPMNIEVGFLNCGPITGVTDEPELCTCDINFEILMYNEDGSSTTVNVLKKIAFNKVITAKKALATSAPLQLIEDLQVKTPNKPNDIDFKMHLERVKILAGLK